MASHRWIKRLPLLALIALTMPALWPAQAADEFSSGDKLRTLYSNHFSFTDDGLPQLTIEIMGGQSRVEVAAREGLSLMPDGEGGSRFRGSSQWTLTLENGRAAKTREWIIMARFAANDSLSAEVEVARWKKKGHRTKTFETGTIFAVEGEVLDTREILVGIDPTSAGKGLKKSRDYSERFGVNATFHTELVRRPSGTVIARSGSMEVRNPSVIWFSSNKAKGTVEVKNVRNGGGGSQLTSRTNNRRYFGSVYVTVGSDGKLSVVNAVAADALLSGLVPSEMFPDAPMEALKAQSIAARTELLQKLGVRHFGDPFLLCATQHCQVYSGAGHEHPRTTKAVRSTRGQVMVTKDEELVDSRYSATCGGHSEHNEVVWGGDPNQTLRGRLDGLRDARFKKGITDRNIKAFLDQQEGSFCAKTKYSKNRYRWQVKVGADELSKRVAKKHPGVGRLRSLKPLRRGISGRINKLRLSGDRGSIDVEGELVIRRLLGGLRSSLFVSKVIGPKDRPTSFEFRGAGFGHGVGMCQLGAIGRATAGQAASEILSHYYKNISLHRLY
jgi:SpoIID/LytB domain protein